MACPFNRQKAPPQHKDLREGSLHMAKMAESLFMERNVVHPLRVGEINEGWLHPVVEEDAH